MEHYKKRLNTPGNRRWLKGSVAVNIAERGLSEFTSYKADRLMSNSSKLADAFGSIFLNVCGSCSNAGLAAVIPCDPNNQICNSGQCMFHKWCLFRPFCRNSICNAIRNTIRRKLCQASSSISKCTICSTANIVQCDSGNGICKPGRNKPCKLHYSAITNQRVAYRQCPNHRCDIIREYLKRLHRFGNPSWQNVNAQKWCLNAWQIAKAFFPKDGYIDKETVDETDFNGIISFVINCRDFQQNFSANLSQPSNICTEARDAGKELRHANGLEVSEADLKTWFTALKALFSDPTFKGANAHAQYALDQLNMLENDKLQIQDSDVVASIEDSVEYLRMSTSTSKLENKELHQLEEILLQLKQEGEQQRQSIKVAGKVEKDGLRQEKEIAKEEIREGKEVAVDKVEQEGEQQRQSINAVGVVEKDGLRQEKEIAKEEIREGKEVAVDELEQEGEQQRQSIKDAGVVEKDGVRQEKENANEEIREGTIVAVDKLEQEGEQQRQSIKDAGVVERDVIRQEKEIAKEEIREEIQFCNAREKQAAFANDEAFKLVTLGPFEGIEASLQEIFTIPTIERVNSEVTPKGGTEEISSWKTILDREDQQFVCLTADAGVGKSTFCKFVIEIWCAKNGDKVSMPQSFETFLEDVSYLQEFHYLFYIQLQDVEITSSNIDDILFWHSKTVDSTLTKDNESFDKILSQRKGLIILDGLDEYPIQKVLPVPGNRKYSVMITSRPWKLEKLNISSKKHFHAHLKEMKYVNIKDLLQKAIEFINNKNCTSMKLPHFMALVELQDLTSLLSNPLVALLLLRIYYERETDETDKGICDTRALLQVNMTNDEGRCQKSGTIYERKTQKKKTKSLGKTRAHIYASVIEMMLQSERRKNEQRYGDLSRSYIEHPTLPECFVEATACVLVAKLIYRFGELSCNSLLQGNSVDLSEFAVETKLREKYEIDVLRGSGLLTKSKQKYGFLHHSFKEMFASVFLSSLTLDDFSKQFQGNFLSNISPNIMSFLCVMNYEVGRKCVVMFNEIERNFYDEERFFSADLHAYQNAVLMAFDECVQSGIEKPELTIKHAIINFNSAFDIDHHLLRSNVHFLETLFLVVLDLGVTINPLVFGNGLKVLCLNGVVCVNSIDLSACKRLSHIILQDSRIFEVIITPSNIEELWIYIDSDLMTNRSPMKLTFSGATHFSERLKRLCLENIVLDTPLNLSHCKELRDLEIEKMCSSEVNGDFIPFSNLECCENLEELRLDTLQFTVNDCLANKSEQSQEKNKSAENFNLHAFDCSGLKQLRSITLHDCHFTEITIDPLHLEEFWVYVSPDQISQPKMNVSFCGSSRFSSNLTMLSLVHVGNIPFIDTSECVNLQKLRINRQMTFEKELKHLTEVRIFSVGQNEAKSILEKIASYQSLRKLCLENLASDVLTFIFDHASSFDTVACLNICDVDLTGLDLDFVRKSSARKVTFKDAKLHCSQVKIITKECKRDDPLRKSTMIEKVFKFKNCHFVGVLTDLEYFGMSFGKIKEGILNQDMDATSEFVVCFRGTVFRWKGNVD
ncbi:uncharacterized protein LOC128206150 isoform X2 [Mya arenaria]|uniref:uncharacterized protein LOC128206150 isoform X2 n=1 Tax=Mya arenaria TaxID=6604 RepID=UPI0022E90683|nr:uncharacterized protein LOC128206150 isoform X2 [Mya arenaria]